MLTSAHTNVEMSLSRWLFLSPDCPLFPLGVLPAQLWSAGLRGGFRGDVSSGGLPAELQLLPGCHFRVMTAVGNPTLMFSNHV